ncbi:hypothetical protein TGAM01_v200081, partial [Trichoderma gamsii]
VRGGNSPFTLRGLQSSKPCFSQHSLLARAELISGALPSYASTSTPKPQKTSCTINNPQ